MNSNIIIDVELDEEFEVRGDLDLLFDDYAQLKTYYKIFFEPDDGDLYCSMKRRYKAINKSIDEVCETKKKLKIKNN